MTNRRETLLAQVDKIQPGNQEAFLACEKKWDQIGKPIGSLGRFEKLFCKIAGVYGTEDFYLHKKVIVPMCADNGVIEEGVSQSGHEVTSIVAKNFAKGIATVNIISAVSHTKVIPVDIGMAESVEQEGLLQRKIKAGTANIKKGAAMTEAECIQAIEIGMDLAAKLQAQGFSILGVGEMGIGNTTTASALASVMLDLPVEQVTGRGAGLSQQALQKKIAVIKEAIRVNAPDQEDPLDLLRKLGGFDIAGMTGLFLGAALYHIPAVVDGFISGIAALLAVRMKAEVLDYILPSHMGKEPACQYLMEQLGLFPVIDAELALGEGSGCAMLFTMLDAVMAVYQENRTFEEIQVEAYERFEA